MAGQTALRSALRPAIATYLCDVHQNQATGATVEETTHYPALQNLLNAIGSSLKQKISFLDQSAEFTMSVESPYIQVC